MKQPLIGITTYHSAAASGGPILAVTETYVQAVLKAGGSPVLIPLGLPERTLAQIVQRLDGVLFTGGGDMAPACYGSSDHPLVKGVDSDRDRVELVLYRQVLQRQQPFMGICRGFQVFNVAMGGTLYEDIADQHPGAQKHDFFPNIPRNHLAHPIQVSEGTRLAEILGKPLLEVNSLHHQGLRQVATALKVSAVAPDGIVEAVELPGHPFGLAVQWHPECLQEHESMRNLFRVFIEEAARRA